MSGRVGAGFRWSWSGGEGGVVHGGDGLDRMAGAVVALVAVAEDLVVLHAGECVLDAGPAPEGLGVGLRRAIRHTIPERTDSRTARLRKGARGGRPPGFGEERYRKRNTVERTIQPAQARQSRGHPLRQAGLRLPRHRNRSSPRHLASHLGACVTTRSPDGPMPDRPPHRQKALAPAARRPDC